MTYQIMSDTTGATFGLFQGDTPRKAMDAWAVSLGADDWVDRCAYLGVSEKYRVDGFRIYV